MKKRYIWMVTGTVPIMMSGCATVINGPQQVVRVSTPHTNNATCILSNSKGEWILKSTPGNIKIHRDSEKLSVLCHKKDYADGSLQVSPLYNGGNMGNLILGGLVGMVVDAKSKATYSYPAEISVPMRSLIYPYY